MESRIRILSVLLILLFSLVSVSADSINGELVEAIASQSGPSTATGDCEIGGDCDDDDQDIRPEQNVLSLAQESILEIKETLARCDDGVCRSVSANADKRYEYLASAQRSDDPAVHLRSLNAVREIVEEDIVTLERTMASGEGNEVHREVLGLEEDLLALVNREIDHLDDDSNDDGIEDAERSGDLDSDGYSDVLAAVKGSVEGIIVALERCDDDVCRSVAANADKRYEYLTTAQRSDDRAVHLRSLNAVKGIIEEDIATLERSVLAEQDTTHLRILGLEEDLLALVNRGIDHLDDDSDDDGIIDARDPDDDGDGIPTSTGPVHRDIATRTMERVNELTNGTLRGIEKSDIRRGLLASVGEWTEEERESVSAYVRGLSGINGSDRGLAIAAYASGNERVHELRYDEQSGTLEIEHDEEARVLGFLKMNVRAQSTVDAEGNVRTRFPWWAIGPRTNLVSENPLAVDEMDWVESAPSE